MRPVYAHLMDLVRAIAPQVTRHRAHVHSLLDFISRLQGSRLAPLQALAHTLQQWAKPIAAMWRFSKNNGITEGFHRKMKLIQRRAYGFRDFENYRLRVSAQCG